MTFEIIRGHKLLLFAERLGLHPIFIEQIDKHGTNYVQQVEKSDADEYRLIILAKLLGRTAPFAATFMCNTELLQSLVEKVQVESPAIYEGELSEENNF